MKCGLLGRKLGHSYSPQIHAHLGDYPYTLFEKEPEEIESFYIYGDDFTVPSAVGTVDGKQVGATFSGKYPDGSVTTDETFRLNQAGTYTITYYATENGVHYSEEKSFVVENRSYVVGSAQSSVTYDTYTEYGCNSTGVLARIVNKDLYSYRRNCRCNKH